MDKIINVFLNIWVWLLYYACFRKRGSFSVPSNFVISHLEDYTTMTMEEFISSYRLRASWGDYHPKDLQQWYDPSGVKLDRGLILSVTPNQKIVTSYNVNSKTNAVEHDQPPVTIPYGVGLVSSYDSWGYGIFEWNVMVPKGAALWPAVWLTSDNSWPPEIDIWEGYSDKKGKYGRSMNTNIHCGSQANEHGSDHYQLGADHHGWIIDENKPVNFKVYWTDKFIKIYYNDFLCRVVTEKKHLKWFKEKKMKNVLNIAVRKELLDGLTHKDLSKAPMIVYDFTHYKKHS